MMVLERLGFSFCGCRSFLRSAYHKAMRRKMVVHDIRTVILLKGGRIGLNVVNQFFHAGAERSVAWIMIKSMAIYPILSNCLHTIPPMRAGMPKFDTITIIVRITKA